MTNMIDFTKVVLVYTATCWAVCVFGSQRLERDADLSGILHHYETLHHTEVTHRVKRSADGKSHAKHVEFTSMGKHFRLRLHKHTNVISPEFRVVSVDAHNNEKEVMVETDNIYRGIDLNDPDAEAQVFWEDDAMVATIQTKDEVYNVEPSWRQLPKSNNYSMIVYKNSDLKIDKDMGKKYCGFVTPDRDEASYETADHSQEPEYKESFGFQNLRNKTGRSRRQAYSFSPTKNRCPLLLVADYRFFEYMGQNSHSKTTSYLIGLIDRVDKIYQETDFGNGFVGMGFEIKEVRIHETPTVTSGGNGHYNEERDTWDTKPLLEAFSVDNAGASRHCLAHLFTARAFPEGTLGLSYVASPVTFNPGGICSPAYYKGGYQLFLNTGWSSSLNRYNRRLLTAEADLVTTHEFGHNWGSEHDPDTSECAPSSFQGGKHIMYTYSVSGYDANNKVFSPCSKRSIGAVLASKHHKCFTAPQTAFCGNNKVEENEECDVGPETKKGSNPCCDKNCKLKPKAMCSDVNHVCCQSCQFADADTQCYDEGPCEEASSCSGDSAECPSPQPKQDGTQCFNKGECSSGVCQPFCETKGLVSCACDNPEKLDETCLFCCRPPGANTTCAPYVFPNGATEPLPKGVPCIQGFCNEKGECEKQVQDLVERFWDVIENLSPSAFAAFMKANIVGTVIVLSLVFWIPISCVVHHVDKKKQREDEVFVDWMRADNPDLVMGNSLHIKKSVKARPRSSRRAPLDHVSGDFFSTQA